MLKRKVMSQLWNWKKQEKKKSLKEEDKLNVPVDERKNLYWFLGQGRWERPMPFKHLGNPHIKRCCILISKKATPIALFSPEI